MSSVPSWSPQALEALKKLHGCDWLVYVEGQGDVAFWRAVLERCGVGAFRVEVAGDDKRLARYASAIADGGTQSVVVAGDRDYRPWAGELREHDRIIYTLGYSIENSLYAPSLITRVLEDLCACQGLNSSDFATWLESFCEGCRDLVVLDIADRMSAAGLGPLGNNSARFLTKKLNVSAAQVAAVSNKTESHLLAERLEEARDHLEDDDRPLSLVIRGHFLTHAVLRYVRLRVKKETGSKPSLSIQSLKALLVSRLDTAWADRMDFVHLRDSISRAFAAA